MNLKSDKEFAADFLKLLIERAERMRHALQAIADAEPATISYEANWTYEAPCDGCLRLIAMAREGLEAGP